MKMRVAVLAGGEPLREKLRSNCPDCDFTPSIDAQTDVVIVDSDRAAAPSDAFVQVVLTGGVEPQKEGRSPAVRVARAAFELDPASYLHLCRQLREARKDVAHVQGELEFARHVDALMSESELDPVYERVTRSALEISKLPVGTLLLHDPVVERYVVAYGNDPSHAESGDYLPGIPPDLLQEAISHPRHLAWRHERHRPPVAILAILCEADLAGVLKLTGAGDDPIDEEALDQAAIYIASVAPVLLKLHQLSKNKDLALRDDLTKAYNRRFFESYLDEEIERARRYNSAVSIIFLDLDDLKLVNNLYGHMAGSRVLQEVARRILGAVRNIDKVVRFGGDEFCIILPQTDPEQAKNVATRVRNALAMRPFLLEPSIEIQMSASFGIATYPVHARTKDDLIRQADAAMYAVKTSTKNAICVAAPDEVDPIRGEAPVNR